MIEKTLLDYLETQITGVPVYCEVPESVPETYIVIERTGGSMENQLFESTFAIKSYAPSLLAAANLDAAVCDALLTSTSLPSISAARLNSHYNYTDTATKEYRYQAVFEFVHYIERNNNE